MRIPGPSRTELDALGDRFAEKVLRAVRAATKTAARNLSAHSGPDDLGVIRRSWETSLDRDLMPALRREWVRAANTQRVRIDDALTAAGAELAAGDIGGVHSVAASQYLQTARNRLVSIGNETWEHARDELVAGTQAGESITQLRDRVVGATELAEPRATVIARTEVIGASNRGSLEQMNSFEVPDATKTWLATEDGRTRPAHAEVNGTTVDLKDSFEVDGESMDGPHDPGASPGNTINCRCTLTYDIPDQTDSTTDEVTDEEGLTAAADVLAGAMIALVPSATDLSRLAVDGGEPTDQLHLTLCYLGDAVLYDDVMRSRITAMLGQLLDSSTVIEANGFGVAMWNPDAPDPAWVLNVGEAVDEETREQAGAWDLESVHELIAEMLEEMGAPVPDQHEPWSPHVCLIYSSDTGLMPDLVKRVGPLTFDAVRIAFAGDVLDITLA